MTFCCCCLKAPGLQCSIYVDELHLPRDHRAPHVDFYHWVFSWWHQLHILPWWREIIKQYIRKSRPFLSQHMIEMHWHAVTLENGLSYCVSPCRMRSHICRMDSQSVSSSSWLVALSVKDWKSTCFIIKCYQNQLAKGLFTKNTRKGSRKDHVQVWRYSKISLSSLVHTNLIPKINRKF